MADLVQTAANVKVLSSETKISIVQVGEAVTQGQPGYRNTSDGKHYKADANDTAAKAVVAGIFLTPAPTDGYAVLAKSGPVDLGATLAVGKMYVLSHTLGAIKPIEDLASTHYVTLLGVASTTSRLELEVDATGVQFA